LPSISEYLATAAHFARRQVSNVVAEIGVLRMRPTRLPKLRQCDADGFSILVNANEIVGRAIYLGGNFEREEVRFLEANVKPEDICFDIGANIGYFSLIMAKLASRGAVYSMEPVPFNFQLLNTNIQLNRFANVHPYRLAASDAPGRAEFTVSADGAFSSFIDTKRMPVESRIVVDVTTLDKFCEANSIARIDCLKVDVEGAEGKMLAGAAGLLSDPARRPRFIILELYNPMLTQYGCDIQRIVALLRGYGYEPYVDKRGQLTPFTERDYDIHWNVFFLARPN
jgi:FkbM family methyltransferase